MPSATDLRPLARKGVACCLLELGSAVQASANLLAIEANLNTNSEATGILVCKLEMNTKRAISFDFHIFCDRVAEAIAFDVYELVEWPVVGNDLDLEARTVVKDGHAVV